MSKQTLICVLAALLLTIVTTVIALIIAVAFSMSTTVDTGGISAAAGGVSYSVFTVLLAASPVLFIIFLLIFRRLFQKRR